MCGRLGYGKEMQKEDLKDEWQKGGIRRGIRRGRTGRKRMSL